MSPIWVFLFGVVLGLGFETGVTIFFLLLTFVFIWSMFPFSLRQVYYHHLLPAVKSERQYGQAIL